MYVMREVANSRWRWKFDKSAHVHSCIAIPPDVLSVLAKSLPGEVHSLLASGCSICKAVFSESASVNKRAQKLEQQQQQCCCCSMTRMTGPMDDNDIEQQKVNHIHIFNLLLKGGPPWGFRIKQRSDKVFISRVSVT